MSFPVCASAGFPVGLNPFLSPNVAHFCQSKVSILDEWKSSFSELIRLVESGDPSAEERLWNEFYENLLRYVESRVRQRGVPKGLLDEEAITVSVLESIFKCAKQGRLQSMRDRSELSRLLLAITNRKFVDHLRRATAQKMYPGAPLGELRPECIQIPPEKLVTYCVAFEEQLSRLMDLLPDDIHRQIAVLKLAGYTLNEIGLAVDVSVPTVNRKWRYIRRIWADELER